MYLLLEYALVDDYLERRADRDVVERFAEQDPYVRSGLVSHWTIRPWNVVVG